MKDSVEKLCRKHTYEFQDNRLIISLKENKSEYRATNVQQKLVANFRIDQGLMKGMDTKQCDHLLLIDNSIHCGWFFIELKDGAGLQPGDMKPNKKLQEGIEQIENAIHYMQSQKWLISPSVIESRIVSCRIPNVGATSKPGYRSLEKKYKNIGLKFKRSENI